MLTIISNEKKWDRFDQRTLDISCKLGEKVLKQIHKKCTKAKLDVIAYKAATLISKNSMTIVRGLTGTHLSELIKRMNNSSVPVTTVEAYDLLKKAEKKVEAQKRKGKRVKKGIAHCKCN